MKKYLALAILPLLASCSSTQRTAQAEPAPAYSGKGAVASVEVQETPSRNWWPFGKRPSKPAANYAETNVNKGMSYPMAVVDQSATSSLDVTEDSAGVISGVGTRQVRNGANIGIRSLGRGANVVRKEGGRYAETVYDVGDQGTGLIHDEMIDNSGFVMNGYERTMHAGGTVVCGAMTTYSNTWDSATRGLFGGLLRCTVRDTKPYMVGSLNDQIRDNTMPGAGWRKPLPDLSGYAPVAATSGKGVYTSAK